VYCSVVDLYKREEFLSSRGDRNELSALKPNEMLFLLLLRLFPLPTSLPQNNNSIPFRVAALVQRFRAVATKWATFRVPAQLPRP
jgi:hypothetical protein